MTPFKIKKGGFFQNDFTNLPHSEKSISNSLLKRLFSDNHQEELNKTENSDIKIIKPQGFQLHGLIVVQPDGNYVIGNYSEGITFLDDVIQGTFLGLSDTVQRQFSISSDDNQSIILGDYNIFLKKFKGSIVGVIYQSFGGLMANRFAEQKLDEVFRSVFASSQSFESEIYNDASSNIIKRIFEVETNKPTRRIG